MTNLLRGLPERIETAAIMQDGNIYTVVRPGRHHDVMRQMFDMGIYATEGHVQGFYTNKGRFVDRREALVIAQERNQLIRKTAPAYELFSEDLW